MPSAPSFWAIWISSGISWSLNDKRSSRCQFNITIIVITSKKDSVCRCVCRGKIKSLDVDMILFAIDNRRKTKSKETESMDSHDDSVANV